MKTALAFLEAHRPAGYACGFARLRWHRAFSLRETIELTPGQSAAEAFREADAWVVVLAEAALPLGAGALPAPAPGTVLAAAGAPARALAVHTLRELEAAPPPSAAGVAGDPSPCPALAFRTADFPPRPGESVSGFLERLLGPSTDVRTDPQFAAVCFDDPSDRERPEIGRHIPASARRLLDVGCGSGGTAAAARGRGEGLMAVGIEPDPAAAARARGRLDRVLEASASTGLAVLGSEGERFDAFLFADVLEHLEDPAGALSLARALAHPGATLVASVPNVGHLSLARDLLLGRFDPVPAGLADAGHLRWFTRRSLAATVEEAGWRVSLIEAVPGAPAPEEEPFLAWARRWPSADPHALRTYQWIAVAVAD